MMKVFLVEDEIVVREGIKNNINWEEQGFIFCGEASDGELAFPMIQKLKPDIVITDIQMPFMDGLELSRLIKRELPNIKIIILSGYGEFEYAKEAINVGVTEYLLKPISSIDLMKCLRKVSDLILRELLEKENLAKFEREMLEYKEDEKRRLFIDLVNGTNSLASLLERGKELNLELSALAYNIILLTLDMHGQTVLNSKELMEIEQEL
jgi:two-component system response regulator YesN